MTIITRKNLTIYFSETLLHPNFQENFPMESTIFTKSQLPAPEDIIIFFTQWEWTSKAKNTKKMFSSLECDFDNSSHQ